VGNVTADVELEFPRPALSQQTAALVRSWNMPAFALFMEQGTCKTGVVLRNAAILHHQGLLNGLIILADNGLHRNWVVDEMPLDWPVNLPWEGWVWDTGRSHTKTGQHDFDAFCQTKAFPILAMNIEALITPTGKAALRQFTEVRKPVMTAIDESTCIANPGIHRTKTAMALGARSAYRRILTGTPFAEGPLKAYAPFRFLDTRILGFTSFTAFKAQYAEWELKQFPGQPRPFLELKGYKNLEELKAKIAPYSYRVLKSECMDLPPKLYEKRYFPLSPLQQQHYTRLKQQFEIELAQLPLITVDHVLTRRMRLQQIASGFVGGLDAEGQRVLHRLGTNARLEAFRAVIEATPRHVQSLVWARFIYDIDEICRLLANMGESYTRYDGSTPQDQRTRGRQLFQAGECRWFVGNPRAGGKGLNLQNASQGIFYTNDSRLEYRLQAEDRQHRSGSQIHSNITYLDMVALGTVDEKIVTELRDKKDISDLMTGDRPGEWL
jgi:hypothetical protein